jgi:hypothetical protein
VGVGLSIVAHGLMSQDFADRYMSTKKYKRFHSEEIKTIKSVFPSLRTKFNSSEVKFGPTLEEKDGGESLICEITFNEEITNRISTQYNLDSNSKIDLDTDPFYLVLRKTFKGNTKNTKLPPIIQFLRKILILKCL